MLTCFGFSLFCLADTSSPALENNLSVGTEVPGMHSTLVPSAVHSWGVGHNSISTTSWTSFRPVYLCFKYFCISTTASELDVGFHAISATCWSNSCHNPCSVTVLAVSVALGSSTVVSFVEFHLPFHVSSVSCIAVAVSANAIFLKRGPVKLQHWADECSRKADASVDRIDHLT